MLDGALVDFYAKVKDECSDKIYFQQNNASCYTSKKTQQWFDDHGIPVLYHPTNSPELNPIEPIWHKLKMIVCTHRPVPSTIEELKAVLLDTWDQLDVKDIDKDIVSYPDRVEAVLAVKGGHTWF